MVAEFEADLTLTLTRTRTRTREGMAIAKVACKLRGRKPKLPPVAGEAPGAAAPYRCPHDQRKCGALRRRQVDGVPSYSTCGH
jgi:hypothetical protein